MRISTRISRMRLRGAKLQGPCAAHGFRAVGRACILSCGVCHGCLCLQVRRIRAGKHGEMARTRPFGGIQLLFVGDFLQVSHHVEGPTGWSSTPRV